MAWALLDMLLWWLPRYWRPGHDTRILQQFLLTCYCAPIRHIWFHVYWEHLPEIHDWFRYPIKTTFPRGHLGYGTGACCVFQQRLHPSSLLSHRESRHMPRHVSQTLVDCIWSAFLRWFQAAASMWNYLQLTVETCSCSCFHGRLMIGTSCATGTVRSLRF
jgi:hypothetical protein